MVCYRVVRSPFSIDAGARWYLPISTFAIV